MVAIESQTPSQTEYRYIGDNPNNYVYFNCDSLDNQNSSTCEVWRIIGVFDVDDGTGNYEQRIKLVRGSSLETKMLFYNGVYLNYWEVSRVKSFLNDEGEYYTRTGSALNYGLKENAKNLISDAKYYLGDVSINSNNEYGTADALYLFERSNYILNYENFCSGRSWYAPCRAENYCEDNPTDYFCTISKYWVGKVGLMYPSDEYLVYANGVDAACYNDPTKCFIDSHGTAEDHGIPENGWIYNSNNLEGQNSITGNWFITATYNNINYVSAVHPQGDLYMEDAVNDEVDNGVRPVLYLSSNVKITDGTGEQNNPYKHGL